MQRRWSAPIDEEGHFDIVQPFFGDSNERGSLGTVQVPKDDTTPEEENKEAGPAPKEAVSSPEKGKSDPAVREKAPIKRDFVPSEKIPADQAVDFPADI